MFYKYIFFTYLHLNIILNYKYLNLYLILFSYLFFRYYEKTQYLLFIIQTYIIDNLHI